MIQCKYKVQTETKASVQFVLLLVLNFSIFPSRCIFVIWSVIVLYLIFFFPCRSESLICLVLVLYILLHHVEWLSDWLYVTDTFNGVLERVNVAQLVVNDYRKYNRDFLISQPACSPVALARSHLRDSGVLVLVVALEMLDVGTTLMVDGGFYGVVGDGNFHTYVIRDPPVAITTGQVDKKSVNKNCVLHLLIGSKTQLDTTSADPFHSNRCSTRQGSAKAQIVGNKYVLKSNIIGGVSPSPMRQTDIQ